MTEREEGRQARRKQGGRGGGRKKEKEENEIKDIGGKERKKDIICTLHDPTGQVPKKLKKKKSQLLESLQDTRSTQNILIKKSK